jgi:hypothetical protein
MKYIALTFLAFGVAAAFCPTAFAQAAAEYGMGAGLAATSTAPARNLGKEIGGVFDSLNKVMTPDRDTAAPDLAPPKSKQSVRSKQSAAPLKKSPAAARVARATQPARSYEDPRQIQAGIGYDEIISRFGPPSMSATAAAGRTTLWYSRRDGNYQIEMEAGKVTSIAGTNSK